MSDPQSPLLPDIFDVIDGTWPPAETATSGPFVLRKGEGGGNRVSAASLADSNATPGPQDIAAAAAKMRAWGQKPIFMIRPDDTGLDATLDDLGYDFRDPVTIYACPIGDLCDVPIPPVCVFTIWKPLAIMVEIWAAGGIGPARLAIMDRVAGPKAGFLARHRDKPAGTAFAAIHDNVAMLHALEVLPHQRRGGMGAWITRAAAIWAADAGAQTFAVLCTENNTGANALYTSLGLKPVGKYHYRHHPQEPVSP